MTSPLSPDAKTVDKLHRNDDVNKRPDSHHHTLGSGLYQAAGGRHNHQGGDSSLLFDNITITGSRSLNTADVLNQVINALVTLGITNSTGP